MSLSAPRKLSRWRDTVIRTIYPPQCLGCTRLVGSDFALCPECWRATPFITGLVCCRCGIPVLGEAGDDHALCEPCHADPPPWAAGRAALLYDERGRDLVLALKHGDRLDLARTAGLWMANAADPILPPEIRPGLVVVPVPLHPLRLLLRRYNQAALLGRVIARARGLTHLPDALIRTRSTPSLDGLDARARHACMQGTMRAHPRHRAWLGGRHVLLVDDVMTSGATFRAAAQALAEAEVASIRVISLARVANPG